MKLKAAVFALALLAALPGPAAAAGGSSPAPEQAPATRQERLTSAPSYVPLPTFTVGVLRRHSTHGTLVIEMGLDVPDADLRRRARLNEPRVRDAVRTAVAAYANTYYRDRTAPDPTQLTRLIQTAVDSTLGAPGARVLLANMIYQRRSD
jgi:flagellar basal body-associated protein FliL